MKQGDLAPDFRLGEASLHEIPGKKIVFFFPKAFTPGCTNEVLSIQSAYTRLQDAGYTVIGVSMDKEETQQKFADSCELDYTLVSDRGGEIAKAYGVKIGFSILSTSRRVTFIIDEDNRVLDIWNLGFTGRGTELGLKSHGEELLQRLGID